MVTNCNTCFKTQAVSRLLLTADTTVKIQQRWCGICDKHSSTETSLSPSNSGHSCSLSLHQCRVFICLSSQPGTIDPSPVAVSRHSAQHQSKNKTNLFKISAFFSTVYLYVLYNSCNKQYLFLWTILT